MVLALLLMGLGLMVGCDSGGYNGSPAAPTGVSKLSPREKLKEAQSKAGVAPK